MTAVTTPAGVGSVTLITVAVPSMVSVIEKLLPPLSAVVVAVPVADAQRSLVATDVTLTSVIPASTSVDAYPDHAGCRRSPARR